MHDIVAHNLAVMITMADGAVAARVHDPESAAAAMRQVSTTGREALTEMRRLLGVLRAATPSTTVCPSRTSRHSTVWSTGSEPPASTWS